MAVMEEGNRGKPSGIFRNLNAKVAALPMIATVLVVFIGCTLWTVVYSFTSSKSLPMLNFVGFDQYTRLFSATRWHVSVRNLAIYGVLCMGFSLVAGFVLAALMDQKIRFENTFRTIFLYPYALSFIVTGLVWQWIFNPQLGLEKVIRDIGFDNFQMAILSSRTYVIYAIVIAGLWQMTGLVMVLMLAGLRNVDDEIWKAARVDGIPKWKAYLFIILPMMRPVLVTTVVLIATGIVKLYDLVVAMTNGGPGIASEVPAKYVYDFMFGWANLGQGLAASTVMLTTVLIILVPWTMLEYSRRKAR
ncbi:MULTISPECIES: carbohydrate ABC transporter permease [Brucella/Ochrobactrum group]|uniref:Binding-protein-dependent transport systems inner membrane component n=1 Tax=Brucella anthropi (strain ATCC 49188 / DSM 6882 / CCUG 24695 / JCM 21032 / LMG 3331 / NBRC 15819 / NCTC 12168 / Alc 37) TaxID=439375 RepID=A6X4K7_BRUA4|nr:MULTISPECIES: sugar ABC transporter permease [Brucella/Ochrobactrum group]ABS16161.1 binding-protein-dependent transport systems inner membrane component [Brucella anthropi ATCC 49188]KAB2742017.1 sugar ABC transporter permease [Brucella anthropi]KAB2754562.1 sugar ABC transporter permease [Brucella anthropi]KAB2765227.1 sugar ABC transporter permease [Brucella anthropi]KAB2781430.1 sugar ABC transporter permease [Brucella anthropi]